MTENERPTTPVNVRGFLSNVGDALGCGFLVTDAAGYVLFANEVFCRTVRRSRSDILGLQLKRICGEEAGLEMEQIPIYGRRGEYLGACALVHFLD